MSRSSKWFLRGLAAVLVIVLLAIGSIAFILNTEVGTRWAIDRIDATIPGTIRIEQFSGTLWSGLQLPSATYRNSSIDIHVVDGEFRINWSTLPYGRLSLDLLNAKSVSYQDLTDKDSAPTAAPQPFELSFDGVPLSIAVASAAVDSLSLAMGAEPVFVTNIQLNGILLSGTELRARTVGASVNDINVTVTDLDTTLAGDIPLRFGLRWSLAEGAWSGSGAVNGTLAALQFDHALSGPYAAAATGTLRLLHRVEPDVDTTVTWSSWSFGEYILENGEATIRGNAGNYTGEFDVTLLMPEIEPTRVTGTAAGNTEQLTAFDAHAENPLGIADLAGSLGWVPTFAAEAQVGVSGFDPSPFIEELTGDLNANFHLRINGGGSFDVGNAVVTGVLNDAPITAAGSLAIAADQVRCGDCVLEVGSNRVSVDGFYGRGDDVLSFSIEAPELGVLWPEFSGSLDGGGELTGAATKPLFTGDLHGENLKFQHWSAQELLVMSRESTLDAFDLSAAVTSFSVDESDFGSFTVSGKGAPESMDIVLAWQFRDLDVNAEGSIAQQIDGIDGVLISASITEPNTGRWSLENGVQFEISGSDVSVSEHAWRSDLGDLKVTRFSSQADDIEVVASLSRLPLQFANSFLPENLRLSGSANANIDVKRQSGEWSGTFDWKQADTVLRVLEANEELTDVLIPTGELDVELLNGGARVSAVMSVEPGVTAELEATLAELKSDTSIIADLRLEGQDWYWVPAVFPTIDNFEGVIKATVGASGPLMSPEFNGSLNWSNGSLAVPSLNVPLTDINLTVAGTSAGAATVSGTANAGDGNLSVNGRVENLMRATRSVNMRVHGSSAELINWPEYHLWASPDLVVVGTRDGWVISGSFEVPRAEINVSELSDDAVMPSPDVVVIGRDESPSGEPTKIDGVAKLTFGDRVHVNAFGLDTKLLGNLQVRMYKDRPISAEGKVSLVEGVFSAYGQKLTIEEGTLTFTGPLDNPIVDVKAVRVIESFDAQVKAGIHLQGRAQQISSTVYAEPAMAEADAISYLIVGRPLSQATQSEGNELSSAALALGVGQAGRVTEQIGQALGLDQLTVAGDGGDATALVAGKQLNSRLHARYAYGVFSRLGTLLIRYRLSKRLTLEAGAGEAQSIDLLYLVEKE